MDIRTRRLELGLTLEEVGNVVGVGKSTVRKWEDGTIENLKRDKIAKLAEVLQISPLHFIYDNYDPSDNVSDIFHQLKPKRQENVYRYAVQQLDEQNSIEEHSEVYVLGQTAAGPAVTYGNVSYDMIMTNVPDGADYVLNVQGDSMAPLINDKDIVFVKEQSMVENGEIAIVEIDGSEVTCKKFYKEDDKVILKSINDKYDDMVFEDGIRILGKVII